MDVKYSEAFLSVPTNKLRVNKRLGAASENKAAQQTQLEGGTQVIAPYVHVKGRFNHHLSRLWQHCMESEVLSLFFMYFPRGFTRGSKYIVRSKEHKQNTNFLK